MRVRNLFKAPLLVALLSCALNIPAAATVVAEPTKAPKAVEAMRDLFNTERYDDLVRVPEQWRAKLSRPERHALVHALLPQLWSQKELPISLPDGVVLEPRYDWKKGYPKEVQRAKHRVRHDLSTEAGRATWAIEEVLLCTLPLVSWIGSSEKDRASAAVKACQAIVNAMSMPVVDGTGEATVEQRTAAASSPEADPRLLTELAKDPSAEVRQAAAINRSSPVRTVIELLKDPDDAVKAAAETNLRHARRLTDGPGKKDLQHNQTPSPPGP